MLLVKSSTRECLGGFVPVTHDPLLAPSHRVYPWASDRLGETGGERPHERLSKFDPLRTSRAAGSGNPETVQFLRVSRIGLSVLDPEDGIGSKVKE